MPRPVITGENDLATKRPDLIEEWVIDKNLPKTPQTVAGGSNFLAWWRCAQGHDWQTAVTSRVYMKSGCPFCAGRKPIPGETDLVATHPEIADQWHPTMNGALNPTDVTIGSEKRIWWHCENGHEWDAVVYLRKQSGCPYCSGRYVVEGLNDLATLYPEIATEWHAKKNGDKTPNQFMSSANKYFWWQCATGHAWRATINKRTSAGRNCPYCSNQKVLTGYNDLESFFPDIAVEWHPILNGDKTPRDVVPGSNKKYWWVCGQGHEYLNSVSARTARGIGCPQCSSGGGFDSTSTAFIYLIESPHFGARKIGIANTSSGRLEKYSKAHWEVVFTAHHKSGQVIRETETALLHWIRHDLGMGQQLDGTEMGNAGGATETFGLDFVSNSEIVQRIKQLLT